VKTAVAFLVFNRPELSERVFEEIRKARPPKLLVVADGPRPHCPSDIEHCGEVRAILDRVDWDCEVYRNFSTTNMGCGKRVSSGLGWIFEQVEEAIIIEDDCLPDQSFFLFCEDLLERYRHDERVGFIGGVSFQRGKRSLPESYYFSRGHYIWGWASWRRAWKGYDFNMNLWPRLREKGWLNELFSDKGVVRYYTYSFDQTYKHKIDTWDYQWFLHCWVRNMWEIMPNVNLVTNIGHHEASATHTKSRSKALNVPAQPIQFPLIHPSEIALDSLMDRENEADRRFSFLTDVLIRRGKAISRAKEKMLNLIARTSKKMSNIPL
jgi:hypothetical protein